MVTLPLWAIWWNIAMDKFAVIGSPIAHSLSPILQNAMAKYLAIDAPYSAVDVTLDTLPQWVDRVRKEGIGGFNATMPHKEYLLKLVDEMTPEAKYFGAINTVANRDGHLIGHNTDGDGFAAMLGEQGLGFSGKNIAILGAGGSAGAIFRKAVLDGAKQITVYNRTLSRAETLCKEFGIAKQLGEPLPSDLDLLINTIPVGGNVDPAIVTQLPSHCAVVDILYAPPKTPLLLAAEARGLTAINGLGMLIHQAILAFAFFHQVEVDVPKLAEICRKAVTIRS